MSIQFDTTSQPVPFQYSSSNCRVDASTMSSSVSVPTILAPPPWRFATSVPPSSMFVTSITGLSEAWLITIVFRDAANRVESFWAASCAITMMS